MPTTKKKPVKKKSCYRVTAITRVKGNFQWEIDVEAHSKTEAIEPPPRPRKREEKIK